MKKGNIVLISLVIFLFCVPTIHAVVNVSPSSITIPQTTSSTRNITYNISKSNPAGQATPQAQSNRGIFQSGSTVLGTVNTTVTVNFSWTDPAIGSTTESLTIPFKVIKKAKKLGVMKFQFKRTFTQAGSPNEAIVNINLSDTYGLHIERMRLYFKNKRAQITVKKREKNLKTFADIVYSGKGFFRAYWQVNGRLVSRIDKHLAYGKKLTLETPDIPSLPTFIEGSHIVQLIIETPAQDIVPPRAVYYVRPSQSDNLITIHQKSPFNEALLDYSSMTFIWSENEKIAAYLIEFTGDDDTKPVFSAYTRKPEYLIAPYIVKQYFSTGEIYYWRLKGFNAANNIIGESAKREFRFMID